MSCIGSIGLHYNIGLKCKLPKILLTTKMIQHMQERRVETQFQTKNIDAEYFYGMSGVNSQARSFYGRSAAEPLADARGTLGRAHGACLLFGKRKKWHDSRPLL